VFIVGANSVKYIPTSAIIDKAVTLDEMADLTAGQFIIGNNSNRPQGIVINGAIAIDDTGLATLADNSVGDTKISDVAAAKVKAPIGGKVIVSNPGSKELIEDATTLAELEVLNTVTPGTSAASKAVVLDADGKIDTLDITSPKINGTVISASATELNQLAGLTPGVAVANAPLVAGASKQLDVINATNLYINSTLVQATAAELNIMHGVTAVTADVNLLAGLVAAGAVQADLLANRGLSNAVIPTANGIIVPKSISQPVRSLGADATLRLTDNVIWLTFGTLDITLTLPLISDAPNIIYTIMIVLNVNSKDLIFQGAGSDVIQFGAVLSALNAQTISDAPSNMRMQICNNGINWLITAN
jgi:hypothetical protein